MRKKLKLGKALSLLRTVLVCQIVAFLAVGSTAFANPELQEVISGTVEVQEGGDSVHVTNGSIANWQHFNIGADEAFDVNFIVGHEGGNHLAQVVNGLETQILGALTSNGHVYVVNPAGVVVGVDGSIDMPGFHAAAGDIVVGGSDGFSARSEGANGIDGRDRYANLTGAIRNAGTINARVVDLVGRYVENTGSINDPSGDGGYFVLAVGNDIIIRRDTPVDGDGRTNISLIIQGLAPEVLAALGEDPTNVGVVMKDGGSIHAGDDGAVTVGAGLALGAGDFFGRAIDFQAGTSIDAREIHAEAGGHDLRMAGNLTASDVQLCAGANCGNLDGVDIQNVQVDPDRRDRVEFSEGASSIALRAPDEAVRNGEDEIAGTADDRAARLRVESDGSSIIDSEEMGLSASPGQPADLRFAVAAGDLTLRGNFDARDFTAVTARQGQGAVRLDPGTTITSETAVIAARGATVDGVAGATFVQRTSSRNADPETDEFRFQSLSIEQNASMVIDADTATALSADPLAPSTVHRRLRVISDQELRFDDGTLRAGSIELGAGATGQDDLVIGDDVTLAADTIALRSGSVVLSDTSVVIGDGATFESTDGHRVESFLLEQDTAIDANVILARDRLAGDGTDVDPGDGYSRTYNSNFESTTLDAAGAEKLFGPLDVDGVYRNEQLNLILLGDGAGGANNEVRVEPDLHLRSLTLGTGAVDVRFPAVGDPFTVPRAQNVVLGNITTEQDQIYRAGVNLDAEGGAESEQDLISNEGRIVVEGALRKLNPGSLALAAGARIDPLLPTEEFGFDVLPIALEGDVDVANGNLDIKNSFQMESGLIQVQGDGVETGVVTFGYDENSAPVVGPGEEPELFEGQFRNEAPATQIVDAEVVVVKPGAKLTQIGGGRLVLDAERLLLVAGDVSSKRADTFPVADPDAELVELDSRVDLFSDNALILSGTVEANEVNVAGARSGLGTTALLDSAEINADTLVLSASRNRRAAADVDGTLDAKGRLSVHSDAQFRGFDPTKERSVELVADRMDDAASLPDLGQFIEGTEAPEGFEYAVRLEAQDVVVDDVLAGKLEGGGLSDGIHVTLSSARTLSVQHALTARELTLQSGRFNGDNPRDTSNAANPPRFLRDLSVGDVQLNADQVRLIAGDDPVGLLEENLASISVDSGATFRGTDGLDESPDGFVFAQEKRIDATSAVPELAAFGSIPSDTGMDYTVISLGASTGINVDQALADRFSNADVDLTLQSNSDIDVTGDLTLGTFSAHAGGDGTGTLRIGDAAPMPVDALTTLTADEITLRAGGEADPFFTDVAPGDVVGTAEVEIAENARFVGTSGPLPEKFKIHQDGEIDNATLPSLSQFGVTPPPDLSGMEYALRSDRDAILLSDASRIAGSALTLEALAGIELDTAGQPLLLDALTVGGEIDDDVPTGAALTLHQSVKATAGDVDVKRDVAFVADAGEARKIEAEGAVEVDGSITHRGGGKLSLLAENGDVAVSGLIDTGADGSVNEGGDLEIGGDNVTVSQIHTRGFDADSGNVEVTTGVDGTLTIEGAGSAFEVDARESPGFQAGQVHLLAPKIVLGSTTNDTTIFELAGSDVVFGGDTTVVRSTNSSGLTDLRELEVTASNGIAAFNGGVEVDNLTVTTTAAAESPEANGSVFFFGPLVIGQERPNSGGVGVLDVGAARDVNVNGDVSAERISLRAGVFQTMPEVGHDGSVVIDDRAEPITVAANDVELVAGDGVIHEDGGVEDRVVTNNAEFRGSDDTAPNRFVIEQEAAFDNIGETLSRARGGSPDALEGQRIGLVSTLGDVAVNGADLEGSRVRLGGANGVTVTGNLNVLELDLESNADLNGNVTVRGGLREGAGFTADGNVNVDGNLSLTTRARFEGAEDQTLDVNGTFKAPAIERDAIATDPLDEDTLTITADNIELRGSLRGNSFASGLVSAQVGNGSVVFDGDALVLGDVIAEQDVTFTHGKLSLNEFRTNGVVGFDQSIRAGGIESTVPDPDRLPSEPAERVTSTGKVTVNNAIAKSVGGLSIAGLGPDGGGYEINGVNPNGTAIHTRGDLRLEGTGVLVAEGPVRLRSEDGDLAVAGSLTYDDALALQVGEDQSIRTAPIAGSDTAITASSLRFAGDVAGAGSLSATATDGGLQLDGDVILDDTASLALRSGAASELAFNGSEDMQQVEAGSVELNMGGAAPSPVSTIARRGGSLEVRATNGNLSIGEKLTSEKDLILSSTGTTTVSDLTGDRIQVSGPQIVVASRPGGAVMLPDGSLASDARADIVGNSVFFSTTPSGSVTIGTPTTSEISDSLVADNVVNRRIFANGRRLTAADLDCDGTLCDGIAVGGARFESGRQVSTPRVAVDPAGFAALREFNDAAVGSRPLWAQELIAYLEEASIGGDTLAAETGDPRLRGEPVQKAVRIYRGLFAPVSQFDEATGTQTLRSHRGRIREALQLAEDAYVAAHGGTPSPEAYAAFLETDYKFGEALFYLGTFGDLVEQAELAGVIGSDLVAFRELLVDEVAPRRLGAQGLAEAF